MATNFLKKGILRCAKYAKFQVKNVFENDGK